ncbi:MAG: tRNA (adenosine(37)-N6)-threonylcarbamoyltransferase complex ATPase subunit type 1 TsaE [Patescibacteria group bacterium]
MKYNLATIEDTKNFALKLGNNIPRPPIIGLIGPLGCGKTTLTRYLLDILKNQRPVTSPTFVWLKTYRIKHSKYQNLHHLDCYRLAKIDPELAATLHMCQHDKQAITIIEWADKVMTYLAPKATLIRFKITGIDSREITVANIKTALS